MENPQKRRLCVWLDLEGFSIGNPPSVRGAVLGVEEFDKFESRMWIDGGSASSVPCSRNVALGCTRVAEE